jgi:hypothetical protein
MILRIIIGIICLAIVLLGLFFFPSGRAAEQLIPADVGAVLVIHHPVDLAVKLADSDFAAELRTVKSLARMFELLDRVFTQQDKLAVLTLAAPKIYVTVPADIRTRSGDSMPFVTYIRLGRLTKILQMIGVNNFYRDKMRPLRFRGHTMYVKDTGAFTLLPGYLVLGDEQGVMNAISTYKGDTPSLKKATNKVSEALALTDKNADCSILITAKQFLAKGDGAQVFDPRFLINPKALAAGIGNLYIETDTIRMSMTVLHEEGQLLLPYASPKTASFKMTDLLANDLYMAAAFKLQDATQVSEQLVKALTPNAPAMSKLRSKLLSMTLSYFFESVGPEVAIFTPSYSDKKPAVLLELKDIEKARKAIGRVAAKPTPKAEELSALTGIAKELLLKDPEAAKAKIASLEVDQQEQANALLAQLQNPTDDVDKIMIMGQPIHYRFTDNYLYLSPYKWFLDRMNPEQAKAAGQNHVMESLAGVSTEGAVLALVDLLEMGQRYKLLSEDETYQTLKKMNWKVALSMTGGMQNTEVQAAMGLDVGLNTMTADVPAKVRTIYYAVIIFALLVFLAACYGLYWAARGIQAIRKSED